MELDTVAARVKAGHPRERPSRIARTGSLTCVRPGVYLDAETWAGLSEEARHLVRMRAAQHVLGPDTRFSHESAAVALGIPVIGGLPRRPSVLVPPDGSKSSSLVRRVHRAASPGQLQRHDGFVLTSTAQAVLDIAATRSPLAGVVAASHVRRHLGMPLDVLQDALAESRPYRGARSIEHALGASTEFSDSPLETLVLVRIRDLGFAEPVQQQEIVARGRSYRVDFSWSDGALVLEADGRVKYEDADLLDERTPEQVFWAEKRRADAISEHVARLTRTTWDDAWSGAALEQQLLTLGVPRIHPPSALTR